MNLEEYLKVCHQLGLQGVELWDKHLETYIRDGGTIGELREKSQTLSLTWVTIAVNNHDFTSPDPEARNKDVARILQWMHTIEQIGAKILRVLPGDLVALNKDEEDLYPFARSCLGQCLREAEKRGIRLAVENCPRDTDPTVVLRLVEELDSPYLQTCPDIGNIPEDIRYRAFQSLLPYAAHVHAKTWRYDLQGREANIDYDKVMNMLRQAGFDGYISVEFEGKGNEREGVEKGLALVKKYL